MTQRSNAAASKQPPKLSMHQRSRVLARKETLSAYLFLLPSLIFFLGFVVAPMVMCLVYSLPRSLRFASCVWYTASSTWA